ncbi:MAG: FGGY family carbohydrate kinase, partial [Leucobacter sp.]
MATNHGPRGDDDPDERSRIVIGIDAGTSAIKSVAFALDGTVRGEARREVPVLRDRAGRSETDMEGLWRLAVETLREALAALGDGVEIVAIGVTGQGDGAWLVDAEGRPTGPAALWNDARSAGVVEEWEGSARGEAVRETTGSPLHPGALPAIWEAMRRTGTIPGTAAHHLNCKDWLRYRLVGEIATDPSDASRTCLDVTLGEYSAGLAEALGQEDLARILPAVLPSDAVAGALQPDARRAIGVDAAIPVAVGAFDAVACGIGLGAISDGDAYVVLGTTAMVTVNQPSAASRRHADSILLRTGRGEQVAECLAQMSGMPNLSWARATLGLEELGWDEIEQRLRLLDREHSGDAAAGVLFLPYTSPSGERAPFRDVHASGGWVGADVTASSLTLLRAVYTGLAHSVAESMLEMGIGDAGDPEAAPDAGPGSGSITVGGGGAQSRLLCELLADVTGRTVIRRVDAEIGARGAA